MSENENRLDRAVTRFYEKLSDWEESVAEQVGLSPRQCHAVSELGGSGRVRMKPLSERLGVTTGTLTVMADRLQKLGMVRRAEDPDDKRAFNLELTAEGDAVYRAHVSQHELRAKEILCAMSEPEAETFIALLEKASAVL
jgi:DNA-binding MarR family transcriptional regulator